ncbi:MAG: glycosyl transferase group 1 [Rhodocyclaceae bacterium]|nr:glycosyl transferase group 1 [Rhodocyclaceae bacterium]
MGQRRARLGWWCLANALLVAALALHLLSQSQPSTEAVRLRNALVMEPEPAARIAWAPTERPANFQAETLPPDPRFVAVVHAIGADSGSDFSRMLAIAGHLTERARYGGPIQADNWTTYKRIREGWGYCADFTQTFLALAHAAGLNAREWGFSFDGFGGWGHAVVEVYDRQRGHWVFLDVFNNFHVVDRATGEPLDVEGWRAVLAGGHDVRIVLNGPGRFGWADGESGLWEYYRRGINGWYLWLGNAVETYDSQPLVSVAGHLSRALEQATAILVGVHPHIQVLGSAENEAAFQRMRRLRFQLLAELPVLVLASLALPVMGFMWWRRRPASRPPAAATRVLLVGPLPPPAGGMAGQCRQLADLLAAEGLEVEVVRTNRPYWPGWVGKLRGLRAAARLVPYLGRLWAALGRSDVVHVFANSGWAWHLFALPALVLARLRRVPAIVNYRGGEAERFFAGAPAWVRRSLALADTLVVPSAYLEGVFRRFGCEPVVVPNIVDVERFRPRGKRRHFGSPHLIVTRNLEPIYDVATALRAFALVCARFPAARLTVAGSGPEGPRLRALAAALGLSGQVTFSGRIDNRDIHALYAAADVVVNPSTVDNMPVSLLEAFASGVPVVTTDAGGIPCLAREGENALLVPVGDHQAMADAVLALLDDPEFAARLATAGLSTVSGCAWPRVRPLWLEVYGSLLIGKKAAHA